MECSITTYKNGMINFIFNTDNKYHTYHYMETIENDIITFVIDDEDVRIKYKLPHYSFEWYSYIEKDQVVFLAVPFDLFYKNEVSNEKGVIL